MRDLNLELIRTFVAVVEQESFAAAGTVVHCGCVPGAAIVTRTWAMSDPIWRTVAVSVVNVRPCRSRRSSISAGPRRPGRRNDVDTVRTASMHGKVKRQGRFQGKRSDWKKAYVRLQDGQKVPEFLEGA